MKQFPFLVALLFLSSFFQGFTQTDGVIIDYDGQTREPSAILEVFSTTQGFLAPRLTLAQRNAITNPATSLLIFQTDNNPGYYYNLGTPATPQWERFLDPSITISTQNDGDWTVSGNNQYSSVSGNVGINSTTPSHKLHVIGTDNSVFRLQGIGSYGSGARFNFGDQNFVYIEEDIDDNIHYYAATRHWFDGGNVGIGTTTPTAKLDVVGSVKIADGNQAAGKVLTSDANGLATWQNASGPVYTIGLWPELGGYVFWVSADGKHGLVAETQDQGTGNWYMAQDKISNPSNHSVNGQKFRDWRMPTKFELNEMYLQRASIGGFTTWYWSSTGYNSSNAWLQSFATGGAVNSYNLASRLLRSVRAF